MRPPLLNIHCYYYYKAKNAEDNTTDLKVT